MKRLILITLLIIMMIFVGCGIEGTIDGFDEEIYNIETVPNSFFTGTKVTETITELIVEITTLISETQTKREVEQTTRSIKTAIPSKLEDMVEIINDYRNKHNISHVKISYELCRIAEIRAEEASTLWSHLRPNGQGIDSLFADSDYQWSIVGENLAKCENATSKQIVDAWMQSETHRANLLNPRYKFCGIAEYYDGEIRYISIILTD